MRSTPRPQLIGLLSISLLAAAGLMLALTSGMGDPSPGAGAPVGLSPDTLAPSADTGALDDVDAKLGASAASGSASAEPLSPAPPAAQRVLARTAVGFAEFRSSIRVTDGASGLPIVGATVTEVFASPVAGDFSDRATRREPLDPTTAWRAAAADDRGMLELVCRIPDGADGLSTPPSFDVRVEAGGYVGAVVPEVEGLLDTADPTTPAEEMARDAGPVREVALFAAGSLVLDVLDVPPDATGRLVLWASSSARGRKPFLEFLWPLDTNVAKAGGVTLAPSVGGNQRLVFEDLPPGPLSVALAVTGSPVAMQQGLVLRSGQQLEQVIRLTDGEMVNGIVRDLHTKAPVQGVAVALEPTVEGLIPRLDRLPYPPPVTDERGAFSIPGAPMGKLKLELHTADGATHQREVTVVSGNITRRHEFYVRGAASLSGRVRAPDGLSLAGVQVLVTTADVASDLRALSGGLSLRDGFDQGSLAVVDPATGRFRAEAVPSGRALVVHAMASGSAYTALRVAPIKLNETMDGVELVLEPRQRLSFRVESASGEPVTNVSVRLRGAVEALPRPGKKAPVSRWGPRETLEVQADGLFSVAPLVAKPHKIRLYWDGRLSTVFDWPDEDAEAIPTFEIVPPPVVLVNVRDTDGVAVRGARVKATLPPSVPPPEGKKLASSAYTDQFGRARLRLPSTEDGSVPGPFDLNVATGGYSSSVGLTVDEGDALPSSGIEVVLERAEIVERAVITGRLVRGNGEPLPGPRFDGLRGGAAHVDGHSFELRGIRPGRTKVVVHCHLFESQALDPVVLRAGERLDVGEILVRPATMVAVTVKDPRGKIVKNAQVQLVRLPPSRAGREGLPRRIQFPAELSSRRDYRRWNIPRARWRLVVKRRGYKTYQRELRLKEAVERLEVELVENR